MTRASALLLQQGKGRRQLPDESLREPWSVCLVQELGQPLARRVVGDNRQAVVRLEILDCAHAREGRMPEASETLHALAQRFLESRRGGQLGTDSKQLEGRRVAVVEHQQTVADAIGQPLSVPAR